MWAAWAVAFGLILMGWWLDIVYVAHLGLAFAGLAVALTVMRDNVRMRRQVQAMDNRRTGGGGGNVTQFLREEDRF